MKNKGNASYTNRPLNNAEREFAALPENHNLIFDYMRIKRLDAETFYDELVLDYLTAVKKYVTEKPELQIKYSLRQVLFQQLNGRMRHYWREYYADSRKMERETVRLDYEYEDNKQERRNRVEPWWIDPMQNVERYVVEKESLNDIYSNIYRYAEPDLLKLIVDMRQEGYSNREIARKAVVVIEDYRDWGIMEVSLDAEYTETKNLYNYIGVAGGKTPESEVVAMERITELLNSLSNTQRKIAESWRFY